MTTPKVALYLRLSREDGETGQSQSIQSQRQALEQFLQGRGWQATEIYMDAGVIIGPRRVRVTQGETVKIRRRFQAKSLLCM